MAECYSSPIEMAPILGVHGIEKKEQSYGSVGPKAVIWLSETIHLTT